MNTTTNNLFKSISKADTKNLVTVVNETIATGMHTEKTFTAADLWNIQRQKRSMRERRRFA